MKIFKKIYGVVTTVILVFALVLAFLLAGIRLIGLTPYTVLSGSMEPAYHVGSLIYVKRVDPSDFKANDPVTFKKDGGQIVTHRIIEVLPKEGDEYCFRTKGDANDIPDGGALKGSQIVGKPIFTIPYLGYVANYVQSRAGLLLMVSFGALLLLGNLIPEVISLCTDSNEESHDKTSGEEDGENPQNKV